MVGSEDEETLPCTSKGVTFVCSLAEVTSHREKYLERTHLELHQEERFKALLTEFQEIFLQHQGDAGHTKLITMDEIGDHPSITQKPFTLPVKHSEWVKEEIEMLKN